MSPDSRYLAFVRTEGGGSVRLFNSDTLAVERDLSPHGGAIAAGEARGIPRWSPDGRMLACGSSTDGLIFWRPTASVPLDVVPGVTNTRFILQGDLVPAWSSDGMHAIPSGGVAEPTLNQLRTRIGGWSANGHRIAWAAKCRDIETGQTVDLPINPYIYQLSPDGTRIAQADPYGSVFALRIRDVDTGEELAAHSLPVDGGIWNVAWSPDDRYIALSSTAGVQLFDPSTGELRRTLHADNGVQHPPLAFSNDGRRLATTPEQIATFDHFSIEVLDVAEGKRLISIDAQAVGYKDGVAWLPDGNTIAVKCTGNRLRMFDSKTGDLVREIAGVSTDGVFNRDASRFVAPVGRDAVRVYSTTTGDLEYTILYLLDDNWVVLSPDGHYRASPGAEKWLCYVAVGEDGSQQTLTPAKFAERYRWKNDPEKAPKLEE